MFASRVGPLIVTLSILIPHTFSYNCPTNPTSFLNQTLYHEGTGSPPPGKIGTFPQQYQLNATFFRPGGPILFYQNAATTTIQCIENTVLQDWAEEMGAIIAGLEHRYFGESVPKGFNDTNPAEYGPLTINNTLLDSVKFIEWIKQTVPGAKDSKAIVMGGSYGGFLTTLIRVHYPETFYGALPSSPELTSFGIEAKNQDRFNWQSWISRAYRDESAEAAAKIERAMYEWDNAIKTGQDNTRLAKDIGLCEPYPKDATEWTAFYETIKFLYWSALQLNYNFPLRWNVSQPFKKVIDGTLATNSSGTVIRIPAQVYAQIQKDQCIQWATLFPTDSLTSTNVWERLTCLAYPGSTYDIASGAIFPPLDNKVNRAEVCKGFGLESPLALKSNDEIQEYYRITKEDLIATKRLLFTEGGWDPTTAVGPPEFPISSDINATRRLFMMDVAHGEETFSRQYGGGEDHSPLSPQVQIMQKIMKNTVKLWVGFRRTE